MSAPATPGVLVRRLDWDGADVAERRAWVAALRPPAPVAEVADIISAVRAGGDAALRDLTERFDGATIGDLWVAPEEIAAAERDADPAFLVALDDSIAAVRRFHADQRDSLRAERSVRTRRGVVARRRWVPIERLGAYVPGGRAPLASSLVMLAVPARLADVDEIIVATPPGRDGRVAAPILAAAARIGIDRVLRVGGAQAIAALAYGTESVPMVDRIAGAGSGWVTAAKRAVSVDVAIDLPAGPSEAVVIADGDADVDLVGLDLLAQAEHGPDSVAVLVTDAPALLDAVEARLPELAGAATTGADALATLRRNGGAVLVADLAEGLQVSDAIAPEHLSLQCADADALALRVRNAGAVFIGPWSAVAAGDYATGTNHVLPTGGAARVHGAFSVEQLGRWIEIQRVEPGAADGLASTVEQLAGAEGLPLHAASVRARADRARDVPAGASDPVELLRRPGPVTAYPAEPSDEELAAEVGLDVERLVRMDMNTLPGRPHAEYGDLGYRRLRDALSSASGAPAERIIPGAGADELIRLLTTQAVGEGDAVVIPVPTFAMFAVEARLAGARVIEVPRAAPAVRQPVDEIRRVAERESARLVWLCSPNNPTGDAYELDEIRRLADGLAALVVVDEVYLEFAEATLGAEPNSRSAATLQDELPNVVSLRSLSKAYGIAGVRVGYVVAAPPLAERLDAVRLPLAIAGPSERIAIEALSDPTISALRAGVIAQRDRLATVLAELGCEVLPSVANFVTFRPPDAGGLAGALHRRGLVLRHYEAGPMAGWLRATARSAAETDRLVDALRELLT